jgi:hypothetical protein
VLSVVFALPMLRLVRLGRLLVPNPKMTKYVLGCRLKGIAVPTEKEGDDACPDCTAVLRKPSSALSHRGLTRCPKQHSSRWSSHAYSSGGLGTRSQHLVEKIAEGLLEHGSQGNE